jgi:hypothetical protein
MKGIISILIRFILQQDHRKQEITMGKYAANLNFEGHTLSDKEIDCSPELAPYVEAVKKTAYELAEFGKFGIQAYWLTVEDIEALRQLPKVYPHDEALKVATAIELFLRWQLSGLYRCVQQCEIF